MFDCLWDKHLLVSIFLVTFNNGSQFFSFDEHFYFYFAILSFRWWIFLNKLSCNSFQHLSTQKGVFFVLFCLSHWDFPKHNTSCWAFCTIGKLLTRHWASFMMFQPIVEKLYRTFFSLKIHLNKIKYYNKIWACSWYYWKAPNK